MFDIENLNQILERQCTSIKFRDGKVVYFSTATQHAVADTLQEAIEAIIETDKKLDGKSPVQYLLDKYESTFEITSDDIKDINVGLSIEEINKRISILWERSLISKEH